MKEDQPAPRESVSISIASIEDRRHGGFSLMRSDDPGARAGIEIAMGSASSLLRMVLSPADGLELAQGIIDAAQASQIRNRTVPDCLPEDFEP